MEGRRKDIERLDIMIEKSMMECPHTGPKVDRVVPPDYTNKAGSARRFLPGDRFVTCADCSKFLLHVRETGEDVTEISKHLRPLSFTL